MDKFIGKRLDGRYEIKELIGAGGMAYVYKAYDSIDDRVVAIKILREEYLTNEEFTRRFKNESKAIAILSHPNIVKVYDVSFGERLQYIVMEYIDGITLKEYIDQQKDIKWKEAVHFTVQILRALQHAHDKGIVHRDIKPQNIMLLPDGTIKVTDFGIARFSRMDARNMTGASDKAIGSVHYISPEQVRGEITDEKADIYSVGVMLYEMLTGRLPFEADNAVSVAIMQMQSEARMPREINPQIPEGLEEITVKAMQKDASKRYQSAAEMMSDIEEFKRNPSIHFEYQYFHDDTPTRFVEAITRVRGEVPQEDQTDDMQEADEDTGDEHKGPPVLPILAAIAGVFVLVGLIFGGVALFMKIFNPDNKVENITVDNFVGMNYLTEISADGSDYAEKYEIKIEEQTSDEYPAGVVIKQDPKAGSTVKRKSTVTLYVSKGQKMVAVPEFQPGTHKDVVREELRNAGFRVNLVPSSSDTVAVDGVIETRPAYPAEVPDGSEIIVVYSIGAEALPEKEVPDVTKQAQGDAIARLESEKFYVVKENIVLQNSEYPAGTVISQTPVGGSKLTQGKEVKLVVSSGFRNVNVTVKLPSTSNAVDIQIFIDGVASETRSGLIPSDINTITLKLTKQKASYKVRVKISGSGANQFEDYALFDINGLDGKILGDPIYYPFVDTSETTVSVAPTTSTHPNPTSTTTTWQWEFER